MPNPVETVINNNEKREGTTQRSSKPQLNAVELAQDLVQRYTIIIINGGVYMRSGNYWKLCDNVLLEQMIMDCYGNKIFRVGSHYIVDEIIKFIPSCAYRIDPLSFISKNGKAFFRNGVVDIDTGKIEEYSMNYFNLYTLNVDYIPYNAETPYFDKLVYDMAGGNRTLMLRIWQFAGYLFSVDTTVKRIGLLIGAGNNGKSVFGKVISKAYPKDSITAIPPHRMNDKFMGAALVKSALNIFMDLPTTAIDSNMATMLKGMTGGDMLYGELKYGYSFLYEFEGHLLFGSNAPLRLNYLDKAFAERLLVIPCDYSIPKHLQDRNLFEKIKPELPAIASKAVRFFAEVRRNNYEFAGDEDYKLSENDIYVKKLLNVSVDTSPQDVSIPAFAAEKCEVTSDENDIVPSADLYAAYVKFCSERGFNPTNSQTFHRQIPNFLVGSENIRKRLGAKNVHVWVKLKIKP